MYHLILDAYPHFLIKTENTSQQCSGLFEGRVIVYLFTNWDFPDMLIG